MEPILKNDGTYHIFRVEVNYGDKEKWKSINESLLGKIPSSLRFTIDEKSEVWIEETLEPCRSFSVYGDCFQKTGIYGTFEKDKAFAMKKLLAEYNPEYRFRVIQHVVMQYRTPIEN